MKEHEIEEHFKKSCDLRDAFWNQVGTSDKDVIAPVINPAFTGGPRWPGLRQAFKIVRCKSTTIIASDGLSDPYDQEDDDPPEECSNGLGLEFYSETPGNLEDIMQSWQFALVYSVSQNAAHAGNYRTLIDDLGYVTTELYDIPVPNEFKNAEGRVGVFLGVPGKLGLTGKDEVILSLETIKIVNVKLLTLRELNFLVKSGAEGRKKLADLFSKEGIFDKTSNATISDLSRKSVV